MPVEEFLQDGGMNNGIKMWGAEGWLATRLFDIRFIDFFLYPILFLQADHGMTGRFAPGWHVFFDALIVRDHFQNLSGSEFLDFFRGENNRHWAEIP